MIINKLPVPTWTWLKGNQVSLEWQEDAPPCLISQEGTTQHITTGDSLYTKGSSEYVGKAGETATVLQVISAEQKLQFTTHITGEANTNFTLVQLYLGKEGSTTVSQVYGECHPEGNIQVVQFMLGRGDLYSHIETDLSGIGSAFTLDVGYLTVNQTLDMSLLVKHQGEQTQSDINLEGLIGDQGKKVFRGTIDLQHGAHGAVGQEQETVLLLGENLQNLTLPVLLCGQEDVKGSHGAAIGELDEETLFYLNSRGIDRKTAERMMTDAKIQRIIQKIKQKDIADQVSTMIEEVMSHD